MLREESRNIYGSGKKLTGVMLMLLIYCIASEHKFCVTDLRTSRFTKHKKKNKTFILLHIDCSSSLWKPLGSLAMKN